MVHPICNLEKAKLEQQTNKNPIDEIKTNANKIAILTFSFNNIFWEVGWLIIYNGCYTRTTVQASLKTVVIKVRE